MIKSDELWHHYMGGCLEIHQITPEGKYFVTKLGKNFAAGEVPQYCVPAGYIFGSKPASEEGVLVGCTVSPGFDFEDFKLFTNEELLKLHPEHADAISKF